MSFLRHEDGNRTAVLEYTGPGQNDVKIGFGHSPAAGGVAITFSEPRVGEWAVVIEAEDWALLGKFLADGQAPGQPRATLEEAETRVRKLGRLIGQDMPPGWGFLLILASFGAGGYSTYISNMERAAGVRLLEELTPKIRAQAGRENFETDTPPMP